MIRTLKQLLSSFSLPTLLAVLVIPFLLFSLHVILFGGQYDELAITLAGAVGIFFIFHFRIRQAQAEAQLQRQDLQEKINLIDVEIIREQLAIESMHQKIFSYSQLKVLTEKLGMSFSLEDSSRVLADEVEKLFESKSPTVILYLFHSQTGELGLSFSQQGRKGVNIKAKKGDAYDAWVAKTLKPLLVEDTHSDFRFDADKAKSETEEIRDLRSLMSAPLLLGTRAVGILRLDSPKERQFTTEDVRLLSVIGDLAAVSLENVQLYERVEDLAIRDSLTGLFLRRYFHERLTQEMTRALRRKAELSLLMLDLDEFKRYNDSYGHSAGDIVLKTVSMIMAYMFDRPGNMVCRYGGEEFAVLLPDCPPAQAMAFAEELRKKIEAQSIILRREKTQITASIGVATFPQDAQLKEELIHQADAALYQAKRRGRNCVCGIKNR